MTARMEKVREALFDIVEDASPVHFTEALAEVEEWEAEVQRLGDDVAEQALRIIDLGQKENEAVARAEAAEAEADRLKAALKDNNVWLTSMLAISAVREPYVQGTFARRDLNDAALAPADRNTT